MISLNIWVKMCFNGIHLSNQFIPLLIFVACYGSWIIRWSVGIKSWRCTDWCHKISSKERSILWAEKFNRSFFYYMFIWKYLIKMFVYSERYEIHIEYWYTLLKDQQIIITNSRNSSWNQQMYIYNKPSN